MTAILKNFIGGEWVDGTGVTKNINPSNTKDVVGEYAKADRAQTEKAIAAAKAAFPAWSRSTPQERYDALNEISTEILARREELGRLLAREEGKTLPEGIGEVARAGQIFAFFAGEALRLTGEKGPSVRPGIEVEIAREALGVVGLITPWNFPIAIPAWKIAPALCHGNTVAFKPACRRFQSRRRLGLRRRPDVAGTSRCRGDLVHRVGCDGPQDRASLRDVGTNEKIPARDGRQESAGRARRRRPQGRRRSCDQRRLFLDRPALHSLLAADRHRRHPRPFRRGHDRAPEGPLGRRRAQARRADRPGGGPEPTRPGPALPEDRQGRGRKAALGRRALESRDARLLPAASTLHRSHQQDAHCARRDFWTGRLRDPCQKL